MEALGLDIKLILTHLVGFAITVWILKKFAWKPILQIFQERRQTIKDEFDGIESTKAEVAEMKADLDAKLKDIENLSRQKMNEAINEGQKIAADIKEEGREEAKKIITRAKEELERDIEKARVQLKEEIVGMTIAAAEKVISAKLDEPEHRRLVSDFIDNVEKV